MAKQKSTESHVSKTNKPMGDFYGVGVKNPVSKGKSQVKNPPNAKIGTPPKKMA